MREAHESLAGRLRQRVDLVRVLVEKELELRYRGTSLGVLWSLANPLAFALVLHVAFRVVYRVPIAHYPVFILSALFPWQWLTTSIGAAPLLFFSNAPLLKKLRFPTSSLCLAVVLGDLVHFLATLPVLVALVLITGGGGLSARWLVGIPLLVAVQATLTLGIVLVLASANVFFRDLDPLVRVVMSLLFYLTPVVYPVTLLPESLHFTLYLNPFAPLMVAWRSLVLEGAISPWIGVAAAQAALALTLALGVHRRRASLVAELV
ncbi:MAG TPA: ABC transporter permease [Myxococcota bacterium]|nr:ABC transporter permease [Myxococcota bacterium]